MIDIFKYSSIDNYFSAVFELLNKKENRKKIVLTRSWSIEFTDLAGVYLIFENDELIYVGETQNIRRRMSEMLNSKQHTLRRSLGSRLFFNHPEYEKPSSNKGFSSNLEKELELYITNSLTVSVMPLDLGRKEFEEWVLKNNPQSNFENKR